MDYNSLRGMFFVKPKTYGQSWSVEILPSVCPLYRHRFFSYAVGPDFSYVGIWLGMVAYRRICSRDSAAAIYIVPDLDLAVRSFC